MRKRKTVTEEQPLLLTIDEARSLLQVGRDTMRGLLDNGQIPIIRFGRSVRVSRQAILNFIDAQTAQAQQAG